MQRRSLILSFRDAFIGIGHVLRTQRNAKIQCAIGIAAIALAIALRLGARDLAVLALTIAVVLAAEIANTAVETLVDAVLPQPGESARITKDAAAGAVLTLAIGAVAVGFCLLGPPLWSLFARPEPPVTGLMNSSIGPSSQFCCADVAARMALTPKGIGGQARRKNGGHWAESGTTVERYTASLPVPAPARAGIRSCPAHRAAS
jgi:diacylglycerol kinase